MLENDCLLAGQPFTHPDDSESGELQRDLGEQGEEEVLEHCIPTAGRNPFCHSGCQCQCSNLLAEAKGRGLSI